MKLFWYIAVRLIACKMLFCTFFAEANFPSQKLFQQLGFTENNISSIEFDEHGFLWVASLNGLFAYNGNELRMFNPSLSTKDAIHAIDIRNLYKDKSGAMWIATNSGGLSRYHPQWDRFSTFRHDASDPQSLSNDSVYSVSDGPDGLIWIATQNGLNRYDPTSHTLYRFDLQQTQAQLGSNYIYTLYLDSDNRLWIGTLGGGLAYWDRDKQMFIRITLPPQYRDVFAIQEHNKELWIGTRTGLLRLDGRSFEVFPVNLGSEFDKTAIISLYHTKQETLLLGTHGKGLLAHNVFSKQTKTIHSVPSQSSDIVTSIKANNHGQVFFSTWGDGVRLLNTHLSILFAPQTTHSQWHALPDVRSLLLDQKKNKIWIGSFREGLFWLDLNTQQLDRLPAINNGVPINGVMSMAQLINGDVYVGTTGGLWILDSKGKKRHHFQHNESAPDSLGKGFIRALEPSSDGSMWIGTGGSGLYRHHDQKLTSYSFDITSSHALSGNYITALLEDGNYLWVGTRSNGLNRCVRQPWHCEQLTPNNSSLSHFYVTDITKDTNGNIWIGTEGGGLNQAIISKDNKHVEFIQLSAMGVAVKSVVADDDGTLWVASNSDIAIYSGSAQKQYSIQDPLLLNAGNFNQQAVSQTQKYHYFGTHNGLLALPNSPVRPSLTGHPLRYTNLSIGEPNFEFKPLTVNTNSVVKVPWGHPVQLEFALLDYSSVLHRYQYRISSGSNWLDLGKQNRLNLVSLEPGSYEVEVRGENGAGIWSSPEKLKLMVIPPWWRDNQYRLFALFFICISVLVFHHRRVERWQRYSKQLERLKDKNQQVIEQLTLKETHLQQAYQGIRNLTKTVQITREHERQSISRELHDQFGQTLAAIKINLQTHKKRDCRAQSHIDDSIELTNSMIAQVRAISFNLRPVILDDVGLAAGLNHQLIAMTKHLSVEVSLDVQANFPDLNGDFTTTIFRVVQEAVNNAIKHSNGSRIDVTLAYANNTIQVTISDNGKGFNASEVKNKLYQGRHLGLLGMEERVLSLGGTFQLTSIQSQGSKIVAEFPYALSD